ncbi:hypothetical protein PSTT_10080 [Puccinia striiformis]|uniref:Uncharacterized protein n=1 Tax=Puccinia striiformis TaxID=27350 RepID=A0A2S4V5Q5_9BASI|nr:hypothetical protein PSTT_10080 [Puccinia striiformis]
MSETTSTTTVSSKSDLTQPTTSAGLFKCKLDRHWTFGRRFGSIGQAGKTGSGRGLINNLTVDFVWTFLKSKYAANDDVAKLVALSSQ